MIQYIGRFSERSLIGLSTRLGVVGLHVRVMSLRFIYYLVQPMNKTMNPLVESFILAYENDYKIVKDFYTLLPEDKYDFRLVETEQTRSDSPKESLAHILEVQLMYVAGCKTGKLEFKDMDVNHYWKMSKEELLAESNKLNNQLLEYISSEDFDPQRVVEVPWGKSTALGILYEMRSHLILHEGWNLALMDILEIPRYESLKNIWG